MTTYTDTIMQSLTMGASADPYISVSYSDSILDAMQMGAALTGMNITHESLPASIGIDDSIEAVREAVESMIDAMALAGLISPIATQYVTIVSRLLLDSTVSKVQAPETWVINSNTEAMSQYDNYGFIAFFEHEGQPYGMTQTGIYRLDGETDNGADIESFILTGKDDMGESELKRLPYAYVGAHAPDGLTLTVFTDKDEAHTYDIPATDTLTTQRAIVGKALRSRYWQIALRNVGGGMFSIESLELLPTAQGRKLNG